MLRDTDAAIKEIKYSARSASLASAWAARSRFFPPRGFQD
jgi:hypothetical protein